MLRFVRLQPVRDHGGTPSMPSAATRAERTASVSLNDLSICKSAHRTSARPDHARTCRHRLRQSLASRNLTTSWAATLAPLRMAITTRMTKKRTRSTPRWRTPWTSAARRACPAFGCLLLCQHSWRILGCEHTLMSTDTCAKYVVTCASWSPTLNVAVCQPLHHQRTGTA